MPTYAWLPRFRTDFDHLRAEQQTAFLTAVVLFVADLGAGKNFRPGLRVKGVQGASGIFEMTWAADGRATFQHGEPLDKGEPHIVWRRVGTHDVLRQP